MTRVSIQNDEYVDIGWFDLDAATEWQGERYENGASNRKEVTDLWLTASGKWVIEAWDLYQGSKNRYSLVNEEEAAQWLIRERYALPEQLTSVAANLEV